MALVSKAYTVRLQCDFLTKNILNCYFTATLVGIRGKLCLHVSHVQTRLNQSFHCAVIHMHMCPGMCFLSPKFPTLKLTIFEADD